MSVAGTSGLVAVGIGAIPGVGPFIAVAPAAVGFLYSRRAIAQSQIAHDPPRGDFNKPTEIAPSRLNLGVVADTPLDRAASALMASNDEAGRALKAMIRAVERAWGAELAAQPDFAQRREGEAFHFATLAGERLVESSGLATEFGQQLEEFREVRMRPVETEPTLEALLPDPILALLYRLGIPRGYLRTVLEVSTSENPVADFIDALGAASEVDDEYGKFLRGDVRDQDLFAE